MTHTTIPFLAQRRWRVLCIVTLIVVAVARIVLSYHEVSQTIDESSHIATGIEWLDQGDYSLNQENPPLARVAVALGPYLSGAVSGDSLDERVHVLRGNAPYPRTLYLARLGTLPFFVAATLLVWAWGVRFYDHGTGLVAAALFTMLPSVLAHAGLATTDMAATASSAGAILALTLWMEQPSRRRCVLLGCAVGLAVLIKFTSILFLAASAVAFIAAGALFCRKRMPVVGVVRRFFVPSVTSLAIAGLVVWAGYLFSVGPIRDQSIRPYRVVDQLFGESGGLHDFAYRAIEAPIYPAPEFFGGIGQTVAHSSDPHPTYLLGETRAYGGFWSFFPIAFLVKTPIPFILFAVIGFVATIDMAWRDREWTHIAPLVSAAAVMFSAMPSGVNVGLRHILAIFPMLSLVAAAGILYIMRSRAWRRRDIRWATLGLCAWFLLTSILSHPNYLPYFNALAGSRPEEILADSDLDWGQDVGRLSEELRNRGIEQVHLGLFTTADLDHFDWPESTSVLGAGVTATGWVAASMYHIKVSKDFGWLEAYEPVDTVGHSIRLYFIPDAPDQPVHVSRDQGR